ncbi:MAG: FecR domain-containing protein [Archangium sp.]|nr:FecR domain-containing protein [Archangium sp.]
MKPWREEEPDERAAKLLHIAAEAPAAPPAQQWDDVVAASITPPRSNMGWAVAALLAVVLGVSVTPWSRAPEVAEVPPSPSSAVAVVVPEAGSVWRRLGDQSLLLERGRLDVDLAGNTPTHVIAGAVEIEVTTARFAAQVVNGHTTVDVVEGNVMLRFDGQRQALRAGEHFEWPRAVPSSAAVPPPPDPCDAHHGDELLACLRREAQGAGLAAETALFELAAIELRGGHPSEAVAAWSNLVRRFPDGVLHLEARLALLRTLVSTGRSAQAAEVARDFERCCSADVRATDVRRLRRQLQTPQ